MDRPQISRAERQARLAEQELGPEGATVAAAMPDPPSSEPGAGRRAVKNTAYRTAGETIGRFASLLLFAEAGHRLGQNGLGVFVFGMAVTAMVMYPLGLGLDRYIVRLIAEDPASQHWLFFDVLGIKVALTIPAFALTFLVLDLAGTSEQAQAMCWVLLAGVFSDSVARTQLAVFAAHERNGPPAAADSIQRVLSAVLGILGLNLGYGVISVGVAYSIGSMVGVVIGFGFMATTIGVPARTVSIRQWRRLASQSLPFATSDILIQLLARLDAVILAILTTEAVVGLYGAVYRLFESTLLVPLALVGAFSAQFTYLDVRNKPSLGDAFTLSVRLALILLVPFTVVFLTLAGPICHLIYGSQFLPAAPALRLLGPAVPLMGLVSITSSLIVAQGNPWRITAPTAAAVTINLLLNFALVPVLGASGAAIAMLATEVVFVVWVSGLAVRMVRRVDWAGAARSSFAAGLVMAGVTFVFRSHLWLALVAGCSAYVAVLVAVEWGTHQLSVAQVTSLLRQRWNDANPTR